MGKTLKKRSAVIFCVIGLLLWIAAASIVSVRAADSTYPIYLSCKNGETAVSGMTWKLYELGIRTDSKTSDIYSIKLNDTFSAYQVDTENMTASDVADVAKTLESYAVIDEIEPYATGVTDENGFLQFTDLPEGVYLLCGEQTEIDSKIYVPAASIVESGSNMSNLDWTVYPKFEVRDVPEEESETYTVMKVWKNDENEPEARPYNIEAEIYCNGELYETVTLSGQNDWTYTWEGDPDCQWKVVEKNIPDNYTVIVRDNLTQFVIVNTFEGTPPQETTTTTAVTTVPDESASTPEETTITTTVNVPATTPVTTDRVSGGIIKLPQTGQLWWPVPVLILAGFVSIAVGIRLKRKNK